MTTPAPTTPRRSAMRGRAREAILAVAVEEFNAAGVRAVSADRIIARARVSKVTFYRHFPAKDDLVVAYLEREFDRVRGVVERATDAPSPGRLSQALGDEICRPGFRGCPFVNAAAEYPEADHPVRNVVARFRQWMVEAIASSVAAAGLDEPQARARQIMMLRDGALVEGYVSGDAGRVGDEFEAGVRALLA